MTRICKELLESHSLCTGSMFSWDSYSFFCKWPSAQPAARLFPLVHHLNSSTLTSHFRIDHFRSRPFVLSSHAANTDLRRETEMGRQAGISQNLKQCFVQPTGEFKGSTTGTQQMLHNRISCMLQHYLYIEWKDNKSKPQQLFQYLLKETPKSNKNKNGFHHQVTQQTGYLHHGKHW